MTILDVSRVSKHFGGIRAVSDVSFSVAAGEILACVGPNAAGKTTLLNLITGWQTPDGGDVYVEGKRIHSYHPEVFAGHGIVRTFQRARLFQKQTVLENLLLAARPQKDETLRAALFTRSRWLRRQAQASERAEELLDSLGIAPLCHRLASALSGGEQRLLELAMVFIRRPKALVLDEPVANLSQEARQKVASFLSKQREAGLACVLVEHDLSFVRQLADKVLVLEKGCIVGIGDVSTQSTWDMVKKSYHADPTPFSECSPLKSQSKKVERVYGSLSHNPFSNIHETLNNSSNDTKLKYALASSLVMKLLPSWRNKLEHRVRGNQEYSETDNHNGENRRSKKSTLYETLSVRGLSIDYGQGPVVKDVSLEVRAGELVSLIGNNGAGKSTLIRAILGLVAHEGEISLGKISLTSLQPYDISRLGISYVPQHRKVFPSLTVLENLLIASDNREKVRAGRRESALQAFPELANLLNVPAGSLSGGQQQMVAIERALFQQPRLLLLDEPSAGLSEALWCRLVNLFIRLAKEGLPILIIEHRPSALKGALAKEYLIKGGRLLRL